MIESNPLAGKTAIVTGAAKRIGKAIALELARNGADVVIHFHRSEADAEDTARAIRAYGVRAWTLSADLSSNEASESVVSRAIDAAGAIDILVNSASIFPDDSLLDFTMDGLHQAMMVNTYAPLVLARRFAAQGRNGAMINFLDARMHDFDHSHVSYQLSKCALEILNRMMADEFAPRIRVNAIAPGLVLPPEGRDEAYLRSLSHTNPLDRVGAVREVTDAALFLLRNEFVTGQVIYIDGGRHMRTSIHA